MFCIQCEQTIKTPIADGCRYAQGICGKTAEVSDLQDVLITGLQGVSFWAICANDYGMIDKGINRWLFQAFFSTLTNVNFDADRIQAYIDEARYYQNKLKELVTTAAHQAGKSLPELSHAAQIALPETREQLLVLAPKLALNREAENLHEDIISLRLLCLYGLKGAAAYLEHAAALGQIDDQLSTEFHQIMNFLGHNPQDASALLNTAMQIGQLNYRVMALLDKGETECFGHPEPTQVNVKPVKGKCILVSGHDLEDLHAILQQTEGKGINVYTHGELLPAHSYPALKKYPHLVGNYGGAWQKQQVEFAQFPGAIVMTSNCIIDPFVGQYDSRIFTRSMVGWPGVKHIQHNDFSEVIECALAQRGFEQTEIEEYITIGFARKTLVAAAPAVVEQIKAGNIKHFFLIGGCDGDRQERNYYTDFAMQVPKDSVILTLGCGKYRFNKQQFGDINGIPRLLDIGQCNDAYSAIQLALLLAETFECGVNDLPLTLVLSWFEQKAVVILLTLLSLGIKGIYTGPTLPAFLTSNIIDTLQQQFDLRPTTTAENDLNAIFSHLVV